MLHSMWDLTYACAIGAHGVLQSNAAKHLYKQTCCCPRVTLEDHGQHHRTPNHRKSQNKTGDLAKGAKKRKRGADKVRRSLAAYICGDPDRMQLNPFSFLAATGVDSGRAGRLWRLLSTNSRFTPGTYIIGPSTRLDGFHSTDLRSALPLAWVQNEFTWSGHRPVHLLSHSHNHHCRPTPICTCQTVQRSLWLG